MSSTPPLSPPPSPPPYPGRRRRADGMTGAALVVLLVLIAFLGWNVTVWNQARTPASGATVSQATVDGVSDPSRPRPGTNNRNFLVLQFHLADGEEGEAAYEERFFGGSDTGDTISVYRDGDGWRTTSEQSPYGAFFSGVGILVLLLMVFGWFKVRREPKTSALNDVPIRRDGPDGI